MNRYLTLWLIGAAMVAFLGAGSPARAMSAYSRIYKMECSECHTKNVPELNDFGIEFYKNRLVIPGKEGAGKTATLPVKTAEGAPAKPVSGAEVKSDGKPALAGGTDGENVAEEERKPVEEPPPTVVYRVKSADGSVIFTDNPLRKGASPEQGLGTGKPASARAKRVTVPSGVKRKERQHTVDESRVAAVAKERYRSYEECMERTLVGSAAPGTAQEMMEFLTTAEKKCSTFPPEKR